MPSTPPPTARSSTAPLRVRIHLNLAKPELAENAVKIQAPSGAWITVGYATELALGNCVPVVDHNAQQKIRDGSTRKVPHAFIEGDLQHFKGRLRDKAPGALIRKAKPSLHGQGDFHATAQQARKDGIGVNYNPRFASCFYEDQADKTQIHQKFIGCEQMLVVGWSFAARGARLVPMTAQDRCDPVALQKTSLSEKIGIRRGKETTQHLVEELPGTHRTLAR